MSAPAAIAIAAGTAARPAPDTVLGRMDGSEM